MQFFKHLDTLDYVVIGIYSVILIGMAIYLQRRASQNLEAYFLGGKTLPWWALGVSGMTNFLDMTGTMIIVSFLYMLGPRGLYIEFRGGAVLVLAFMMLWTGKWHRRSGCMTGAEWYIYRFGRGSGAQAARVITAIAGVIYTFGMLAYLIKGAGLFLSMFMPWTPLTCALIMVGLTTVYTLMSGFYGVVYVDLFQSGIILVSVIVISAMAMFAVAGYDGTLAQLAFEVTGKADWMSTTPSLHTEMPTGYKDYEPLFMFALFYLFRNILGGMGSGTDPRYFGARNERECGILTFFWTWLMTFRWPMMMGFAVLGLFLVKDMYPDQSVLARSAELIKQSPEIQSRYPNLQKNRWEEATATIASDPDEFPTLVPQLQNLLEGEAGHKWDEKIHLVSFEGTVNPERILPAVILMNIPMGLRGLFVVSLVAAAMSTFSPQVNTAVALMTRDMYQAFLRKKASNRELIGISYLFGAFVVFGGFTMAYFTESINDIWDWIIMGLSAGLAIPGLLRLYWWRFNAGGVVVGTGVGLLAAIVDRALKTMDILHWNAPTEFTVLTLIALAGAVLGTYLTQPTDPRIVHYFYRTTRPFGFWGPFKRMLDPDVRAKMRREHFFDIVTVPFALGWQITLFLLPMQIIIGAWRDFQITFVIWAVCLAGVYLLWYRNLPPATTEGIIHSFDPTKDYHGLTPETIVEPMPAASPPRQAPVEPA